ncbi:hypothetical protein [Salana multivorans]
MTTPSDSSATPVNAGPAGPVLRAVVLLRTTPPGVGAVLDLLLPDLSPQIRDLPLNRLTVTVNDVAVTFEVAAGPLVARELDYAVRQSPLRDLVQAAVAQHEGFLVLSADSGEDIFRASELLANVAATYAKDDNGLAVWLPDADHVTTDVMYVGEVAQRGSTRWRLGWTRPPRSRTRSGSTTWVGEMCSCARRRSIRPAPTASCAVPSRRCSRPAPSPHRGPS